MEYLLPSSLSQQLGNAAVIESQAPPPEAEFEDVVVRILWQGDHAVWQVNGQDVLSLAEVKQRLQLVAGIKTDAPVILHPDEEVPIGDVVDVYDISRIAGFNKIQFAIAQ